MQRERALDWVATGFAIVQAGLLLFVGLSAFGIWDPWELGIADDARRVMAGEHVDSLRPYAVDLVARGFGMFGVHEWSGRLPMAVEGLFALGWGYWLAARYLGMRAGAYTVMVAAATPLLLFNGRQMLGHTPEMAAQTFLALAATSAVFPAPASSSQRPFVAQLAKIGRIGWPVAMLLGIANAIWRGGALPCALPPLAAVAVAALLEWKPLVRRDDPIRMISGWLAVLAAVVVGGLVAWGVHADAADYNVLVGGAVHGGAPPTFDEAIDEVFHSFAPFSALLPLALGRLFVRGRSADEVDAPTDRPLRYVLALWAAFGYGAETLFESRYGTTAFLPLMALAAAVAILFVDVEKSRTGWWAAAVIGALLVGLVLRDFAIYPGTPIEGLGLADVTVPEVFKPVKGWALVLVPFALATFLSLGVTPGAEFPDLRAPYRFLQAQWAKGWAYRAWLVGFALLLTAILAFGLDCAVGADAQGIPTLVAKWGKRLSALPIVIPALVAVAQLTLWAWSRLGPLRVWPILVLGAVVGAYATLGYQRELSDHFSPRDVYDAFNQHARPGEPLAELRVGGRAATYYAHGHGLEEMTTEPQLVSWLALGLPETAPRRWAAFPADQLPSIDRAYRQRTHQHLFVADARSARVVLAVSRAVPGLENQSFLARFVHDAPPAHVQHMVNASFQDQIELVGYDLNMPHGDYVGAGEQFTVTWYWRCVSPPPGTWKIFLHVDGMGQRINGDHDPVDEKYPTHLWDRGDVVYDVQQLTVPANYRPGTYTFFIGFYSGESRLNVVRGPKDDANRVRAGDLTVR